MLAPRMRWLLPEVDDILLSKYMQEFNLSEVVARVLLQRGVKLEDVAEFLNPNLLYLHDPFLIKGMDRAIRRIKKAIDENEQIVVYGDYDVDGICSVSLLMRVFSELDANATYYIPNRQSEGYGLHQNALSYLHSQGASLIITVDTGISNVEEIDFASSLGIDVIITDHHKVGETLPNAFEVIHPNKPGSDYPFSSLAGVGVAYKLACALLGRVPSELLDLVALGTVADLVPLIDENRVMVAQGLKIINLRDNIGLSALLTVAGIKGEVSAADIGFAIGPRLNAAGRLSAATLGVELLLADNLSLAQDIASELDGLNRSRRKLVDDIFEEAVLMVEGDPQAHKHAIVVAKVGWHTGVIGIVASRLVERYYRPTVVIAIDKETNISTGSARSIEKFNMHQALVACQDILIKYGGHYMAAGMSLKREDIGHLHRIISELASEQLTAEDYIKCQYVDALITVSAIDLEVIQQLKKLEPCGQGNRSATFIVDDATLATSRIIGSDKNHLKLSVKHNNSKLDAVGFRMAELADVAALYSNAQLLGELQINEWNGNRTPQLLIRDLTIPHVQVFDWRGKQTREQMHRLAEQQSSLFIANENTLLFEVCSRRATWQYSSDSKEGIENLIFVSPPSSIQQFNQTLSKFTSLQRLYFCYGEDSFKGALPKTPSQEDFRMCYHLISSKDSFSLTHHMTSLMRLTKLSHVSLNFIIKVFAELGFVNINSDMVYIQKDIQKKDLCDSSLYRSQLDQEIVLEKLFYSSHAQLTRYVKESYPHSWANRSYGLQSRKPALAGYDTC